MARARLIAWGRLLRLSLAPSAAADAAAGTVLAAGAWPAGPRPFLLVLASLCVYHGGLVLNDWADREEDARVRPSRPIPSGAVGAERALVLALALFALGPFCASLAGTLPAVILACVAALALAYDLGPRGPWLGPLLLGLCRAGNLAAGIALGASLALPGLAASGWLLIVPPLLYGLYVFSISRLARLEDADDVRFAAERHRARSWLAAAALWLVGIALLPLASSLVERPFAGELPRHALRSALSALALALAFPLLCRALARREWTRPDVLAAVGMALRRLLVATGATAASASTRDGLVVAGCILAGYPLSHALRRVFPPT
jgi:4-hydroxybenzoate polyprenyltransferase